MTFDGAPYQSAINMQVNALARSMQEKIDAALAALPPDKRMCLHLPNLATASRAFHDDLCTMRIQQDYHYLGADQTCDVPNRTEYTRT